MAKTILQNTLVVLAAVVVVMGAWALYQVIGDWLFLFFLIVTLVALMQRVEPKFGKKKE